jgi:hypothetical protein
MRIAQRFNAGLSYLSPALNAPQPPKICVHPCESVVLVIRGSFVNSCLMAFGLQNLTHTDDPDTPDTSKALFIHLPNFNSMMSYLSPALHAPQLLKSV